jgi:hypothetical protein
VKRVFIGAATALVVVALGAPTAPAQQPTREFAPFGDDSFSGICSFTVARHVLVNRSYLTTYSNGNQRYTGTFTERLTNTTTGKYLDFNGSGPILLVYHQDGSVTETDWGSQFERPPGQLLLTTGPVVTEYDSSFNVIGYHQTGGTSQDVCELLGP